MWQGGLLVDARECRTTMRDADAETAAAVVRIATRQKQRRAHVAIVADDDSLCRWFLLYESRCEDAGVRIIRVFRQLDDADRWLDILSAARELA
jgi:hypothetical protein